MYKRILIAAFLSSALFICIYCIVSIELSIDFIETSGTNRHRSTQEKTKKPMCNNPKKSSSSIKIDNKHSNDKYNAEFPQRNSHMINAINSVFIESLGKSLFIVKENYKSDLYLCKTNLDRESFLSYAKDVSSDDIMLIIDSQLALPIKRIAMALLGTRFNKSDKELLLSYLKRSEDIYLRECAGFWIAHHFDRGFICKDGAGFESIYEYAIQEVHFENNINMVKLFIDIICICYKNTTLKFAFSGKDTIEMLTLSHYSDEIRKHSLLQIYNDISAKVPFLLDIIENDASFNVRLEAAKLFKHSLYSGEISIEMEYDDVYNRVCRVQIRCKDKRIDKVLNEIISKIEGSFPELR